MHLASATGQNAYARQRTCGKRSVWSSTVITVCWRAECAEGTGFDRQLQIGSKGL